MQSVVESAGGHYVTVVYNYHDNCGELFIAGATTADMQKEMASAAGEEWKRAKQTMSRLAGPDAKRIKLQVQEGKHGSAPVIKENAHTGKIRVVNPDYFNKGVIFNFPLSQEALNRLESDQRAMVDDLMYEHDVDEFMRHNK